MSHLLSRCVLRLTASACLVAAGAIGQIPRGHVVVSSAIINGGPNHGLSTFHSHGPSATTPIVGLPADLTGVGLTAPVGGGSVLVNDRTGHVVVGEHSPGNRTLDVHFVTLSGTTATSVVSYTLGMVASNALGSTDQMAWLGNDVLVLNRCNNLASGSLAGHSLGLVRPYIGPPGTPGTVVPLPLTSPLPNTENAMALDPQQANAYVATFVFSGGVATSSIWRIPVVAPHTPQFVNSVPCLILSLAFDVDGFLLVGTGLVAAGADKLHALDVATGAIVASSSSIWPTTPYWIGNMNGLCCDAATGDLMFVEDLVHVAFRSPRLGGGSYGPPVAIGLGLQDAATGIAYRSPVTTYGAGTAGVFSYGWQTTLLPGGNPSLGNSLFQLAMLPNASTAPTVLGVSGGLPTPTPLATSLGFTLLLDPTTMFAAAGYSTPPTSIPVPIPSVSALAGQDFFFQTVHLEPTGFAASSGLWLTPY